MASARDHGTRSTSPTSRGQLLLGRASRFVLDGGTGLALEPKDALLLAYLAVEGPTPRERLASLLWPDLEDERARGNLRQRLLRLKKSTRTELVVGSPIAQLASGIGHDLEDTYELLHGIDSQQAGGMAEWLDAQRDKRHRARIKELDVTTSQAETEGNLAAALEHATALVDLDPLSEHAHRRVMKLHYLRGDTAAAVVAYERCARLLRSELGTEPSKETQQLRSQLEAALPASPDAHLPRPTPVTLLRPPQTIGRAAERSALEGAWADGRAVLVTGEAGIGKTRLLLGLCAAHPGSIVIDARPGDAEVPLALASRALRAVAAQFPLATEAGSWGSLVEVLPGFVIGASSAQIAGPRRLGPAVGEVLSAAARAGLSGLVVDDLQYGDPASLDLLLEAMDTKELGGLLWAFGSRPADSATSRQSLERICDRSGVVRVELTPFDVATLQAFVESLRVFDNEQALAATLMRRVGGNPMFVLEALRQAHASGAMQIDAPSRLLELMDRRLRAISEPALALARIAAIAGDDFSPELAEAVSGLGPLALASPWYELEVAHLIVGSGFAHDLVYEAARRSVPASIASRLHAAVADFIESRAGEPARIARHRLDAGQDQRAVPHLLAAARRASAAGRGTEAGTFFRRALEIERAEGRPDSAFEISFEGADALSETGPVDLYDGLVELARPLAKSPRQRAALKLLDAVSRHLNGDFLGFSRLCDEALLLAIAAGHPRVEAECRFGKGFVALHQGRLQEAIEGFAAAAALCRAAGFERRAAAIESSLGAAMAMAGEPRRALQVHDRLEPLLTQNDETAERAIACSYGAIGAYCAGEFEACLGAIEQSLQLCRRFEMVERSKTSLVRAVISSYRRLGRYAQALSVVEEFAGPELTVSTVAKWIADERARLYLDLGRRDLAERWMVLAEAQATEADERAQLRIRIARAHSLLAMNRDPGPVLSGLDPARIEELAIACDAMTVRGQAAGTRETLNQCEALLARCRDGGAAAFEAPLCALAAKLLADLGEMQPATEAAMEAAAGLDASRLAAALPMSALWLHSAFELVGRLGEARACIRVAGDWLHRTVEEHVPPEFRDSFLKRHPVNWELLALAARMK